MLLVALSVFAGPDGVQTTLRKPPWDFSPLTIRPVLAIARHSLERGWRLLATNGQGLRDGREDTSRGFCVAGAARGAGDSRMLPLKGVQIDSAGDHFGYSPSSLWAT